MMVNWKGLGRKRSWSGGTDDKYKNLNQERRSLGPRIEPGTSGIPSRSACHSTMTLFRTSVV
jgi:hypothetical protein